MKKNFRKNKLLNLIPGLAMITIPVVVIGCEKNKKQPINDAKITQAVMAINDLSKKLNGIKTTNEDKYSFMPKEVANDELYVSPSQNINVAINNLLELNLNISESLINQIKNLPSNINIKVWKKSNENTVYIKMITGVFGEKEFTKIIKLNIQEFGSTPSDISSQFNLFESLYQKYVHKSKRTNVNFLSIATKEEELLSEAIKSSNLDLTVPDILQDLSDIGMIVKINKREGGNTIEWKLEKDNQTKTFTSTVYGRYGVLKEVFDGKLSFYHKEATDNGKTKKIIVPINMLKVDAAKKLIYLGGPGGQFDIRKFSDGNRYPGWAPITIKDENDQNLFEANELIDNMFFDINKNLWISGSKSKSALIKIEDQYSLVKTQNHGFNNQPAMLYTDFTGGFLSINWDNNYIGHYTYNDDDPILWDQLGRIDVAAKFKIVKILLGNSLDDGLMIAATIIPSQGDSYSQIYKINFERESHGYLLQRNWHASKTIDNNWQINGKPWLISNIIKDDNDGYWISGITGELVHVDKNGNKTSDIVLNSSKDGNTARSRIISIQPDGHKGVYATIEGGYLRHYTSDNYKSISKDKEEKIYNYEFLQMYKDEDNNFYFVVSNNKDKVYFTRLKKDASDDVF